MVPFTLTFPSGALFYSNAEALGLDFTVLEAFIDSKLTPSQDEQILGLVQMNVAYLQDMICDGHA